MQIEFLPPQPDEPGADEDVLEAGARRRPRLVTGLVAALLVVAGGLGWLVDRPSSSRPAAAPSTSAAPAPVVAPAVADALTGCPDTLACDANHQMQQHFIDLIKHAMAGHPAAGAAGSAAPQTRPARLGGLGRMYIVP